MKYKIIDGSTITLAGVASYTTLESDKSKKKPQATKFKIDFDFPKNFPFIDMDAFKEQKEKIKEEAKQFKQQIKDKAKANSENQSEAEPNFVSGFEDVMKNFGKNMEQWGKSFEEGMQSWGIDLDKGLNEFGKTMEKFGEHMEHYGKEFEKEFEKNFANYAHHMDKHWCNNAPSDDYGLWQLEALFNELYLASTALSEQDKSPEIFYEVEAYDLNTSMNDQLTFVGCHISSSESIPYNMVCQQLCPDNWLVLKLSQDEYDKDWILKLDSLELLQDYTLEQYFIVRHFKDKEVHNNKKIKIYVPLKHKS